MKRKEKIFVFAICVFAFSLWGVMQLLHSKPHKQIRIEKDGEEYGTYSLDEDQVISIGTTNVCEIKDGKVRMIRADCPDHLCIRQGAIGADGGIIVCLPNKVVIQGETDDGSAVDSVS